MNRILFFGLISAAAYGFGFTTLASSSAEPVWEGKTLTEWLQQARGLPSMGKAYDVLMQLDEEPSPKQRAANSAIRQIGTNALPFLLILQKSDASLALPGWTALQHRAAPAVPKLIELTASTNLSTRAWAFFALGKIGPTAQSAGPVLKREVKSGNIAAIIPLSEIGACDRESLEAIIQNLRTNELAWARSQIVIALGNVGPPAAPAMDALLDALRIQSSALEEHILRQRIIQTFGKIRDERALPALFHMLQTHSNPRDFVSLALRRQLIRALGDFGLVAKNAIPILEGILEQPKIDPVDALLATESLLKISAPNL